MRYHYSYMMNRLSGSVDSALDVFDHKLHIRASCRRGDVLHFIEDLDGRPVDKGVIASYGCLSVHLP